MKSEYEGYGELMWSEKMLTNCYEKVSNMLEESSTGLMKNHVVGIQTVLTKVKLKDDWEWSI